MKAIKGFAPYSLEDTFCFPSKLRRTKQPWSNTKCTGLKCDKDRALIIFNYSHPAIMLVNLISKVNYSFNGKWESFGVARLPFQVSVRFSLIRPFLKITYFNPLFLRPFFMMLFLPFNILFSQNTVAIEWPFSGIYL